MPVLVNANRFPFLRIKKPQPASLSGIIRSTARTREKRLLRTEALKQERITALDEQQWDEILEDQLGVERDEVEKSVSWQGAIDDSIREIRQRTDRAVKERIVMAESMTDIVDKEAALAQEEHLQRQDKAHKVRKARRLKRQGRDPAASGLPLDELEDLLESNDDAESGFDQISNEIQPATRASHSSNVVPDSSIASNIENGSDSLHPPSQSLEPGFKDSQNLPSSNSSYDFHNEIGDPIIAAPPSKANQSRLAASMNGQNLREALTAAGPRSQGQWSQTEAGEDGRQARHDHRVVYRPTINTHRLPYPETQPHLVRVSPGAFGNTKIDERNPQPRGLADDSHPRSKDLSEASARDAAAERERILQERARRKEEKTRRKEEKARASEERAKLHREAHERKKAAQLHEHSFAGRMKRWLRAHDLSAYESPQSGHTPPPEASETFPENGRTMRDEAANRQTQDT